MHARFVLMMVLGGLIASAEAQRLAGSFVPGADWAMVAGAMAGAPAQQAQAAANVQNVFNQGRDMMAFMPGLMRGQRVVELARTRDCEWVRGY